MRPVRTLQRFLLVSSQNPIFLYRVEEPTFVLAMTQRWPKFSKILEAHNLYPCLGGGRPSSSTCTLSLQTPGCQHMIRSLEARPRRNIHDPPRVKLCEGEKHRRNGVLVRVRDCSPAIAPTLPVFGSGAVLHTPAIFTTGVGAAATRKSSSHIPGIA